MSKLDQHQELALQAALQSLGRLGTTDPEKCLAIFLESRARNSKSDEQFSQREKLLKPLTLKDLKDQVDEEYARRSGRMSVGKTELSDELSVWSIGDFEIRRRK